MILRTPLSATYELPKELKVHTTTLIPENQSSSLLRSTRNDSHARESTATGVSYPWLWERPLIKCRRMKHHSYVSRHARLPSEFPYDEISARHDIGYVWQWTMRCEGGGANGRCSGAHAQVVLRHQRQAFLGIVDALVLLSPEIETNTRR